MAKRNKGRQKVEMVKMQNESNLQVTFSKRRAGLFKKANEICVLCGAEVLLIVFSPGERVYSFGHPSVGSIIDRYLGNNPPAVNANYATDSVIQAHRNANLRELNEQLSQLEKRMEDEKKRAEALEKSKKEDQDKHWWKAPVEELSPRQLLQFQTALEGLKENIDKEMRERMMQSSSASRYFGRNSGPSIAMDIPFVAMPSSELPAPSGLSLFVDHEDIDLNRKASGSGSPDMPDETEHCHVHKFF